MIETKPTTSAPPTTEARPPYGFRKAIEAVKDAVTVEDYLRDQGVEIRHNRGRCVVHGGDNPQSFSINPEKQVWHCFRCGAGGDVITLCQRVEGGEPWEAMMVLAQRYGVELPQRPERWHKRQDEKARVRAAAKKHLARCYQRRLTRVYAPLVLAGEAPEESLQELEALAVSLWPVALDMASRRLAGE